MNNPDTTLVPLQRTPGEYDGAYGLDHPGISSRKETMEISLVTTDGQWFTAAIPATRVNPALIVWTDPVGNRLRCFVPGEPSISDYREVPVTEVRDVVAK